MARLINAEIKVKVQLFDGEHEEFITREMTVEEVLDAYTEEGCPPTVDAVPVVWCKDCEYSNGEYKYCVNDIFEKPNGYCSYGKRKEDAEID
jgi:hypothetical protein